MGSNIGIRRLVAKRLIIITEIDNEREETRDEAIQLTENGGEWIDSNDSQFVLHRPKETSDSNMPF